MVDRMKQNIWKLVFKYKDSVALKYMFTIREIVNIKSFKNIIFFFREAKRRFSAF